MVTRVPHLSTIRVISELPSEVHAVPILLKIFSAPRFPPFRTSTSNQAAPATDHPWSLSTVTHLFSSTFIICNAIQRGYLWTMANFSACNPNKPAPLIAAVTTNQHVQIMQLRRSRPYPLALCLQLSIRRLPSLTIKRIFFRLWILILILFEF